MRHALFLAWCYLRFHRVKTVILIAAVTLVLYVPIGLRVLVSQSARALTARADATPLVIGTRGSPLELVLDTLYFGANEPAPMRFAEVTRVASSGLAEAIPIYTRFRAGSHPIVGTSLDYFGFRRIEVAAGRQLATLGECVLGANVAATTGLGPGDYVVSSPESVFDLAGAYPLRMAVVGVLARSASPDDDVIFADLKTAWVMAGMGHGHQDLTAPQAANLILERTERTVTANATVVEYNEITAENAASFHFHGDLAAYPVSAAIVVPPDQKASALLRGRYEADDETVLVVRPSTVMSSLLDTVLTVEQYVLAGAALVGVATLGIATLVFGLSLRLRRRERETLVRIGGSRARVATVMAAEIVGVLAVSALATAVLTMLTSAYGATMVRAWIRS